MSATEGLLVGSDDTDFDGVSDGANVVSVTTMCEKTKSFEIGLGMICSLTWTGNFIDGEVVGVDVG